ncbi:MAG: hypothetical protein K8R85_04430, partial [Bacteroidetes bacterium]|nr:hypothetical protein [Bacteroidota bacterium]
MKNSIVYLLTAFSLFLLSCNGNRLNVDVSDITVPAVKIDRLEQDIFNIDTANINASDKKLQAKYGNFYSSYISRIINTGGRHDSSYLSRMNQFIADPDMREAYNDCQKTYPNTDFLAEQLTEIFKHF